MNEITNIVPVDRFTLGHFGVGLCLGALHVPEAWALGIAVGWELGENYLKKNVPQIFPDSKLDIPSNKIIDAFSMYLGYKIVKWGFPWQK